MKKAMISQPMAGKTMEEIVSTRKRAIKKLENSGYTVVNTLFHFDHEQVKNDGVVQIPLFYLAKSLESMSLCHAVYFCKDWNATRGCKIEHDAAYAYGLELIYE